MNKIYLVDSVYIFAMSGVQALSKRSFLVLLAGVALEPTSTHLLRWPPTIVQLWPASINQTSFVFVIGDMDS